MGLQNLSGKLKENRSRRLKETSLLPALKAPAPEEFETVMEVIDSLLQAGAEVLLVGGAVRDLMTGIHSNDWDFEVFRLEGERMVDILKNHGKVDGEVGKSFAVAKLWIHRTDDSTIDFDFSLPQERVSTGEGHQDEVAIVNINMNFKDAFRRRDFTINAMGIDMRTGQLLDFFGGHADLMNGVLQATDPRVASDDPLRALRGMQFAGRCVLEANDETVKLFAAVADRFETISKERVFAEWEKWAQKSIKPSFGLAFLAQIGWDKFFPTVDARSEVILARVDMAARLADSLGMNSEDKGCVVTAVMFSSPDEARSFFSAFETEGKRKTKGGNIIPTRIVVGKKQKRIVTRFVDIWSRSGGGQRGMQNAIGNMQGLIKPVVNGQILKEFEIEDGPSMGLAIHAAFTAQLQGRGKNARELITIIREDGVL